ncbi:putative zinc-finger Ran-binding domain protein [Gregarina niphandrodes]|uniref:Zinc-finger Ran-binding domain protein n=1 Tax=Gregarina niphandrodes TaxID=110365 RepID=A0A023B242_GRENI|nr:putative zinc-finger Ran-binding domain protein [Gregarina niphandrodes]EZG50648.1 putative zinc-finger Ran-binding domain protein [Gregarina niphandrodes]|eukprot:XP_011131993.1 putative zinc-finger Ran-binding domain protein [Gregarina niphandrodes]
MRAKDVTQQLIMESDPLVAAEVFKAGLEILGHAPPPAVANERGGNGSSAGRGVSNAGITDAAAAFSGVKLVHPDEFKNPSTFLKIYGDPLCFSRLGPLPKKDRNGNWECQDCGNVNFPRRFRCNMCQKARSPEGDQLVAEYAAQVYERYQQLFKQQKDPSASLSTPDGMQIHYKTNRANNKKKNKQSAQHAAPVPAPSRSPPSTAPQSTVSEVTNGDPAVSESDYISAKYTTPQSSYY